MQQKLNICEDLLGSHIGNIYFPDQKQSFKCINHSKSNRVVLDKMSEKPR